MAVKAKGTVFKLSGTAVGRIISISGPDLQVRTVESLCLEDSDVVRIPTVRDGGSVELELEFDPDLSGHTALLALYTTPAATAMSIEWADAAPVKVYSFTGIVTNYKPEAGSAEEILSASVTIEVSGQVTFA